MRFIICVLLLPSFALLSCSEEEPPPPTREQVEALLKQEAEAMKREGESDINPALGVKVTWTIDNIEMRPQVGNDAEPWAGTVDFTIVSETPDLDGTATETFQRSYDYGYSLTTQSWIMH